VAKMIHRKQSGPGNSRKSDFMKHYFRISELTEYGNEGILDKLENYDSIKQFTERNYLLANIPEKYFEFEMDDIREQLLTIESNVEQIGNIEKYLNSLEKVAEKGIGLYLSGPHGVAKTTISSIILKKAIQLYYKCFFCKSSAIIEFARSGWKSEERKIFWKYITETVDFLVIDDIARSYHFINEAERIYVDEIFTKRDDYDLVTIITANHKLDSNKELFGEALYSNFKERLIEVNLLGDDFRNKIGDKLLSELDS
jgi:DNA replication protein DnaC